MLFLFRTGLSSSYNGLFLPTSVNLGGDSDLTQPLDAIVSTNWSFLLLEMQYLVWFWGLILAICYNGNKCLLVWLLDRTALPGVHLKGEASALLRSCAPVPPQDPSFIFFFIILL